MNNAAAGVAEKRRQFEDLARLHEGVMLRTATRMCGGNRDRAEDLVQDSFVRAYEAFLAGKFDPGGNPKAWLLRIVTNLFINDYNRRKRWEAPADLDTLTAEDAAQPEAFIVESPEEQILSRTLDEPIEKALAGLSDDFRLCVLLVDVEGLEYAEAAKALGIPIGTVRSRLARARIALHNSLYSYAKSIGRA